MPAVIWRIICNIITQTTATLKDTSGIFKINNTTSNTSEGIPQQVMKTGRITVENQLVYEIGSVAGITQDATEEADSHSASYKFCPVTPRL